MNKPVVLFALCLLVAGLLLSACTSARMAVPGFLEQRSDILRCEGRQGFVRGESFTFGEYQVRRVKRGWVQRIDWDLAVAEGRARRQEFEYEVKSPDGLLWQGHAVTGVKREDIRGQSGGSQWSFTLSSDINYVVRFADQKQRQFWTLTMAEGRSDTVLRGELSDGRTVYQVEGTYQLAGTPMPLSSPAGYLFHLGPRTMAAVEVINQGAVYLDRDLDPTQRDVLAVAATALLLYRDISDR